jgi:eukaryotic-like serine/threonine-protein kinase
MDIYAHRPAITGRRTPGQRSGAREPGASPSGTVEMSAFPPGSIVGGFEVVREIRRSGISILLEARDRSLGRRVSLEVLDPRLSGSPDAVGRFRRGASMAARIIHPGLVPVLGSGSRDGVEYRIDPFIDAPSLEEMIDSGFPARGEDFHRHLALRFAGLANAVAALHAAGILHRGIHPGAILVDADRFILCGFGKAVDLACPADGAEPPPGGDPSPDGWIGKEGACLAPEEFLRGTAPHPAADIYALGMTIFEASTGVPAFPACSPEDLARLKLTRRPIAPRKLDPEIPLGLDAVIRQATETSPVLRHRSAADLAKDLERVGSGKRGPTRSHILRGGGD